MLNSFALDLHGFYAGVERIFELIARQFDNQDIAGQHWHRDLLTQMGEEITGKRPAVLSASTISALDEYLAFRHRVRNLYGFELDYERLVFLRQHLPSTWMRVKKDLKKFALLVEEAGKRVEP